MPWHRWSYVSNYVTIHIHPNIFCIDTYTNTSRAADQNRQSGLTFLFLGKLYISGVFCLLYFTILVHTYLGGSVILFAGYMF